ncbi:hypothetical protein [Streptomyces endocoffeicus]|nr:hypothetical protein [Streptomyces endocoffeicus]
MIDEHADTACERQLDDLLFLIGHRFGRADLRRWRVRGVTV